MSTYTEKHRAYYEANKHKLKPRLKANQQSWLKTPKGIYSAQKRKTKQRNITWDFTFETWMLMWNNSSKWDQRGDCAGKYCMSRHNDVGPYSVENTYINLFENNTKEVYERNGIKTNGTFNTTNVIEDVIPNDKGRRQYTQ